MAYIEETLASNEKITYRGHRHWIVFSTPVIWLLLGLALMYFLPTVRLLVYLSFFIMMVSLASSTIDYFASEIVVTTNRVLIKVGWLARESMETSLQNVSSMQIKQTFVGRLLNYGTIIISDRGTARAPFIRIADPFRFRRIVQDQQQKMRSA